MGRKNEIIITNIEFQVNNFEGTGNDYDVECYAIEPEDNDQYVITVYDVNGDKREEVDTMYFDSCGTSVGTDYRYLDKISQYVYDVLFRTNEQSIIKGF